MCFPVSYLKHLLTFESNRRLNVSIVLAGCKGGLGKGGTSANHAAGGGGHGGIGGQGFFNGTWANGGFEYGIKDLPCELGSGSGNSSAGEVTSGGGIIGMS